MDLSGVQSHPKGMGFGDLLLQGALAPQTGWEIEESQLAQDLDGGIDIQEELGLTLKFEGRELKINGAFNHIQPIVRIE